MKTKFTHFIFVLFLVFSCTNDDSNSENIVNSLSTKEQINEKIIESMSNNGNFNWQDVSDEVALAAFKKSDNFVSIAWDFNAIDASNRDAILNFIYSSEAVNKTKKIDEKDDILIELDDELKVMLVKIDKEETFLGLRALEVAEVVEPAYVMHSKEEAMLAATTFPEPVKDEYNTYVPKDDRYKNAVPTNIQYFAPFDNHNIPAAWDAGLDGKDIKVAVIDGGLVANDPTWGINGDDIGLNTHARTVEKKGYYKWNWWWPFGGYDGWQVGDFQLPPSHGLDRCDEIGGPLGEDTGIAYHSDITSVRSSWGIWIDPLVNSIAVAKSYKEMGKDDNVKIISMSQGSILNWIWITRAIQFCHNRGKMMFAAGGTFYLPGVQQILTTVTGFTLYPARLSTVHSCTGIKNLDATNNNYLWGTVCFGTADFVFEFNETWTQNVSQASSSASTAGTAGMAALIWADNPSFTREQVLQKMIESSDFPGGTHPYFKYGRVDMQKYLDNR